MSMLPQNVPISDQARYGQPAGQPSPYFGGMAANYGQPHGPGVNSQPQPGVDIVGPVLRRKLLVLLLGVVGASVGYLGYQKAEPVFSSSTQVLLTSQAPPEIVNGETVTRQISIPKYERLISSHLILNRAAEKGNLKSLPMFSKEIPELIPALLMEAVNVKAIENEQSILLSAKGKYPEDLPTVLVAIVDAFNEELKKDSNDSGRDSVELISKMRDQLGIEKKAAEDKYFEILKNLDTLNLVKGDELVNPYTAEIESLTLQRSELSSNLRELTNRIDLAEQRRAVNDENENTVLLAESRKYLGFEMGRDNQIASAAGIPDQQLGSLRSRVDSIEKSLALLGLKKKNALRAFGSNHPVVRNLTDLVSLDENELVEVNQLIAQAISSVPDLANTGSLSVIEQVESRNQQWIDVYFASMKAERTRLSISLGQLDEAFSEIETQARAISDDVINLRMLKNQIAEKQQQIEKVVQRLGEIDLVVSNNFVETKVRVINPAGIGEQIAPSFLQYLGGGIVLGLLLGTGLAVLIDRSDLTYRNPGEIFERLKVPVVSKIPMIKTASRSTPGKTSAALVALRKPTSTAAEAFRAARTALFFVAQNENFNVFLLTSPSPGDGKSTTCANLAISIAQAGKRVVLVDADFRGPRVHAYFGETIEPGIMQSVLGTHELDDCLRESEQENLTLLTCGGRPKNPGEIVTSPQFVSMIQRLREKFDIVLIDSPPLLPVADAAVISTLVDGVYMVMRIRKGIVVTSSKAKEKLDMVNANLLGVIVNGIDDNPHYNEYGSYGYGYGYSAYGSYGNGRYYESRNSKYQEKIAMKD